MNKYEMMVIVRPDLNEEEKKNVFDQIADVISKNEGSIASAGVWAEKRRMYFPIKKQQEGIYYLVNFTLPSDGVSKLKYAYKLNEAILRVLILRDEN